MSINCVCYNSLLHFFSIVKILFDVIMVTTIYCANGSTKTISYQAICMLIVVTHLHKNPHCHGRSWHITDYFNCIPCLNRQSNSKHLIVSVFYWHFLVSTYFQFIKSVVKRYTLKLCRIRYIFNATVNIKISMIWDVIIYEI